MSRPFSTLEQETILSRLRCAGRERDALLVELGCYLGFRISELLSLHVDDVAEAREVRAEIVVARRNLKGGKGSRCRAVRSSRIHWLAVQEILDVIGHA
jgi:integrase